MRAGRAGRVVGGQRGVQRHRGARLELGVLVEQQAEAPARAPQQRRVVLGLAAALLERDHIRGHRMPARRVHRAVGRRVVEHEHLGLEVDGGALAGDRVQAIAQERALLGVDDAEGELDGHQVAYCRGPSRITRRTGRRRTCQHLAADARAVLDLRRPARLDAGALRARAGAAAPAARARRPPAPAGGVGDPPRVSLIVAAYREEAVIAAKVANALALDWPRERLEVIVAVDGGGDAHRASAPAPPGADLVLELPRGGQDPRPGRGGAGRARRAAGVLGRQRAAGRPDALRELAAAVRRPARSATSAAGSTFTNDGRDQPGGPVLALRACGCARRSRRWPRSPAATARSTPCAARPTSRSTRSWATTSRFPFRMVKRGWRAVYAPARAGDGEDGPVDRGRVGAQAADDVPRLADRRAAAGCSTRAATRRCTR